MSRMVATMVNTHEQCFRLLNAMHHTVHMRPWGRHVTLLDTLLDTHECGHDYAGICRVCPDLGILDFEMS